jgi:hypothetical protein
MDFDSPSYKGEKEKERGYFLYTEQQGTDKVNIQTERTKTILIKKCIISTLSQAINETRDVCTPSQKICFVRKNLIGESYYVQICFLRQEKFVLTRQNVGCFVTCLLRSSEP